MAGSLDICGDGIRSAKEQCDDGNTVDGDGCSSDCKTIEFGFEVGDHCVARVDLSVCSD